MSNIEIYVHVSEKTDPLLVAIEAEATVLDLLRKIDPKGHENLTIIIEGREQPLEHHHKLHHAGIGHHHHVRCRPREVKIIINGPEYDVRPGKYTVPQIKDIPTPKIPKEETLCQMVNGVPKPLKEHETVCIEGGEVFASNCPSAAGS